MIWLGIGYGTSRIKFNVTVTVTVPAINSTYIRRVNIYHLQVSLKQLTVDMTFVQTSYQPLQNSVFTFISHTMTLRKRVNIKPVFLSAC